MNAHPHLSGYQITEELYTGTRTLVYRGIRIRDRQPVVIKLLRSEYPTFNELVHFRNQYTIAKNLDLPSIVQPLDLAPYKNAYALVMEDFGGISLLEYLHQKIAEPTAESSNILALADFFDIAIQLANSLDGLIHQRVIHKDIKPANILINPDTKQVKLIDFSISSLLPRETQEIQNPNVLEGTIAYLSPEQTGRMNRGIDYRTDFYSLGVTFYELLTGQLPFASNDLMELVHCHIAKIPPKVHTLNPAIPPFLSAIVSKLMAKNAENRYQSAFGLKYDLEIARSLINADVMLQGQQRGTIPTLEIGQRDLTNRFLIPEKLYGREPEVKTLLNAFERVANPSLSPLAEGGVRGGEMMLVAGFSGIGKTVVVNEVHKPIVRQRGYFIKGKYDQFQRNIPFSAFVQAFRDLMDQLLSESDAQLHAWKTNILSAVGDNGQVLIEVIPELERIIGPQHPASELSGSAAQNRFNLLMQKFVQVFTTEQHPLVIFLDDLQWADGASLKLLQLLMEDTGHLLVLGAYRDNEVSPVHPFILTVDEIVKAEATVNTITLQPLSLPDMNQLVANTLNCDLLLAQPLTELVYQKTKGNPFFATQFLKALHDDNLITFDWDIRHWQCDIAQVRALAITDDVVEFMAVQLQKLPTQTQEVLKLAACIGAQFDMNTLAIVAEKSPEETAAFLWKALQEGFILPTTEIYKFFIQTDSLTATQSAANPTYKFLHDRVQQAAYSLIPDEQKQIAHLKIGQLLLTHTSPAEKEEKLFEIVNQLNIGKSLILSKAGQIELAKLNLKAGQKARAATAYTAAFEYCTTGIALLGEERWQPQYELTLALYEAATETAYLSGKFEQMKQLAAIIAEHSKNLLDTIKVYEIQIQAAQAQHQFVEAVQIALKSVERLGTSLPEQPSQLDITKAFEATKSILAGRQPLDLITLPQMKDPNKLAVVRILTAVSSSAFVVTPALLPFIVLEQVNLSVQYGNASCSANGYAYYGLILCGMTEEIDFGYQCAKLALLLLEHFNAKEMKARVYVGIYCSVWHWKEPLKNSLPFLREGYQVGLETGDLESATICGFIYISYCWFMGRELSDLSRESAAFRTQIAHLNQEGLTSHLTVFQQAILNLIGDAAEPWRLRGDAFDREEIVPALERSGDRTVLYYFYATELSLCYLFGKLDLAVEAAIAAEKYIGGATGLFIVPLCYTYDSLAHLAIYSQVSEAQQQDILQRVAKNQEKMKKWADRAPENYVHKFYLVEAERYRVLGQKSEAIDLYDRAISLAKEHQFLNEEALANELAAKFYLEWGREKFAQVYAIEAYYAYSRWGAKAKVEDLEKRYSQLLTPILQQSHPSTSFQGTITHQETIASTRSSSSVSEVLDLASLLKASQAISGEIELDKLLATLLKIAIANAGASKCVLLLKQDSNLQVTALVEEEQEAQLLPSIPLELSLDVAISLVNTVKRSLAPLVLADARLNPQFAGDPYIEQHQPKSILCSPILNQSKLIGILYLENNLTVGAFTSDRVELLNLLCAQAAISLENARLYQQSQIYAQQLEQALHDLQQTQLQMIQSEKMSALGNLVAGVAHEINNPVGFISGNLNEAKSTVQDLVAHLNLYRDRAPKTEITDHAEDIDLDYIIEDLPKMIDSMQLGCDRIQGISTSLRTFSRVDKDYKVPFNIHEGIDSTILILKYRLKANDERPAIEIVKDYGSIPAIECFPGQINQVFMNIMANAIDALDELNMGRTFAEIKANPNRIKITTFGENQEVKIAIADNGKGISETVQQKIFDQSFTMKGVGKGTGLGLAIAQQIVTQKHGGSLQVNSRLGEGTEFIIILPTQEK
ncbi:AAA family ATPase [Kamptonema animale CS-326]|jgi:predicted ATPase/signal transduction histidine kinase|uniref:trifunctional serine/threonine-protein kinase/ATP-binding protein/sensor histidine kinase n=1 Tax=Kamptonema animale TaxID=92934 RepID=UPI002330F964|nr:ATP-binding sensor histidine kinase [Kamptonema animale]MDB9509598.1 AAA family ATPase [Kamptonema animale CS-326]